MSLDVAARTTLFSAHGASPSRTCVRDFREYCSMMRATGQDFLEFRLRAPLLDSGRAGGRVPVLIPQQLRRIGDDYFRQRSRSPGRLWLYGVVGTNRGAR